MSAPSVETARSWVVAGVALAILTMSYGAPMVAVVALKPIAEEFAAPRSAPALAVSLTYFGAGLGGIAMGWLAEFRKFVMRGNVVDLAVGIIIGAAFTTVVGSLVKDVFNPVLGLLTGGIDFSNVFVALDRKTYATLEDARKAGAATLNIGLFINAIVQFLIVSFAVFWVVKALTRLNLRDDAKPPPTKSEQLLEEIRDLLKKP